MASQLISNAEAIDFEDPPRGEALGQPNFIKLASLVSVLLHALLLLFLIRSDPETAFLAELESIEIKLLPSNPHKAPAPLPNNPPSETLSDEQPLAATETSRVEREPVPESEQSTDPITAEPDASDDFKLEAGIVTREIESGPLDLQEPNFKTLAPSIEAISQSVRDVSRVNDTQFYAYRCNPLEEEEGLKKCAPSTSAAYEALDTSTVYQAFNPSRAVPRSEQVSSIVSSQASGLSDRLRGQLPEGISGYLIEELEAGITHNVNEGNRAVNLMIEMTDKSSAAAQARQVLGNPLLLDLKRARENPARGVLLSPP